MPPADDTAAGHGVGAAMASASMPVPDVVAGLLVARAAARLVDVTEVRCTWLVERPVRGWSRSDREWVVAAAAAGGRAWQDGQFVSEPLGSQRWLAWFPRPVGPHHAVNVPSPLVEVVAAVIPSARVVRCHLAMRTWQAEVLQAMGNLARTDMGRRVLDRWVHRAAPRGEADLANAPAAVAGERWATVVELVDDRDHLVRGWAHGRDRSATGRALRTAAADRGDAPWGDGDAAAEVLDLTAVHGADLRWSVGQPAAMAD